jgi:hypothetical protein
LRFLETGIVVIPIKYALLEGHVFLIHLPRAHILLVSDNKCLINNQRISGLVSQEKDLTVLKTMRKFPVFDL